MSAQSFQDGTEAMRRFAQGLRTIDVEHARLNLEWHVLADKVRRDQRYGPAEADDLARLRGLTDQITANLEDGMRLARDLLALVEAAKRRG